MHSCPFAAGIYRRIVYTNAVAKAWLSRNANVRLTDLRGRHLQFEKGSSCVYYF